jgi:hypothetical protein
MSDEMGILVHLTRMEGKMDLIHEKLNRQDSDLASVRTRQHEMANSMQALANVPDKLALLTERVDKHSNVLIELDRDKVERRTTASNAKALWTAIVALGTIGIAAIGIGIRAIYGG